MRDYHDNAPSTSSLTKGTVFKMKIVLSLCCVTLAMLFHPVAPKNESGAAFRIINIHQGDSGYGYFESMAITSSQDFNEFLEISQELLLINRQAFVDALLKANVDFNQEALVLLRYDHAYGASRIPFETPVLQEKTLICEIREPPLQGAGITVVSHHCFALVVSKSLVNKVQLNVVAGFPESRSQPTALLSTTERQPLKIRRNTPPPKPSPGECPTLILGCPPDVLETGKTYLFKLEVENGSPKNLGNFNWSVTGGEIVGGQGTLGLAVRINRPNEMVKVWVSLGGINPHCDVVTNCSCGPTR